MREAEQGGRITQRPWCRRVAVYAWWACSGVASGELALVRKPSLTASWLSFALLLSLVGSSCRADKPRKDLGEEEKREEEEGREE